MAGFLPFVFYMVEWSLVNKKLCFLLIIQKRKLYFQSLNHVDINLKPQFLIKSGYYIAPSPSTALLCIIKREMEKTHIKQTRLHVDYSLIANINYIGCKAWKNCREKTRFFSHLHPKLSAYCSLKDSKKVFYVVMIFSCLSSKMINVRN